MDIKDCKGYIRLAMVCLLPFSVVPSDAYIKRKLLSYFFSISTLSICILITGCSNPLLKAAKHGDVSSVKQSLSDGVDVNYKTRKGATALIVASYDGHLNVVNALIDAGADINVKTDNGTSALLCAATKGYNEITKVLLQAGANVEIKGTNNETALMIASYGGHLNVVNALLDAGADPNLKRDDGMTALMFASQKGQNDVVSALLNAGANPDVKKNNGTTAYMIASKYGHTSVLKTLRQAEELRAATVKKDNLILKKELKKQVAKLNSYKTGVLTREQFVKDGWNGRDAFHGKIGIVKAKIEQNEMLVALGMLFINKRMERFLENSQFEVLLKAMNNNLGSGLTYDMSVWKKLDYHDNGLLAEGDVTEKGIICVLMFKDGLLTKKACGK